MVQFTRRTLTLVIGLIGVIIAFIINVLYSSLHVLGRVTGISSSESQRLTQESHDLSPLFRVG
jgi:hypothetical protein